MTPLAIAIALKSTLLVAAVAAALALLRVRSRTSAAWRHLMLVCSVAGLLVLPVFAVGLPAIRIPVRRDTTSAQWFSVAGRSIAASTDVAGPAAQPASAPVASNRPVRTSTAAAGIELTLPTDAPARQTSITAASVIVAGYLAGVLLLLARLGVERIALFRIARRATTVVDPEWTSLLSDAAADMRVNNRVRLLRSTDRCMPVTFGIIQPAILIPAVADTWSTDRRRTVVLHELAHVARRDCLWQVLSAIACAMYWVHPGAWWIARRLRAESELACDDRVLAAGTEPRAYAGHLLEIAYSFGGDRSPALAVGMARPRQLEGRMLALLDAARSRTMPAGRVKFAGLLLAAAIVAPLAAAEIVVIEGPAAALPAAPAPLPSPQTPKTKDKDAAQETSKTARDLALPGTWELRERRSSRTGTHLEIQLHERANSWNGFSVAANDLQGFNQSLLSSGGSAQFSLKRDAGTLAFEGLFRGGVGGGTYSFTPSAAFASELVKRGYERPADADLYRLAVGNIGVAYLDELRAERYTQPTLALLVKAANHGVDLDYLRDMRRAGHGAGQLDAMITMRDHGVDPEFIQGLSAAGLGGLTSDELVRARDHGVDPEYVAAMKHFGAEMSLGALVRTRDHGVDAKFVEAMRALGFTLSPDELVNARDHGVDPEFADGMAGAGYKDASLADLIAARDHGVGPDFADGFRKLGYSRLALRELIRMRDHGVTPEWARRRNDREGARLTVDELVRLRDRGGN